MFTDTWEFVKRNAVTIGVTAGAATGGYFVLRQLGVLGGTEKQAPKRSHKKKKSAASKPQATKH